MIAIALKHIVYATSIVKADIIIIHPRILKNLIF